MAHCSLKGVWKTYFLVRQNKFRKTKGRPGALVWKAKPKTTPLVDFREVGRFSEKPDANISVYIKV